MRIPLSWISLYSPVRPLLSKYTPKELAHEYSVHTAEIDEIEISHIEKVVVGKVISTEKHPESKKLTIVKVNLGNLGDTTILTAAPNIEGALYVPVALVGAVLPGNFVIGERIMAGMMSSGMICSDEELGLTSRVSEGIMILENVWKVEVLETMIGKSFFDLEIALPGLHGNEYTTPVADVIFEIDNKFITNRPDLFSVVGNAREFHAVFETPFIPYSSREKLPKATLNTEVLTNKVLSYHLLGMDNIEVGDSPWGMRTMMHRAGLTSKMDIVDITNMIMTELGQPLHAFDADKVEGHIIVRPAKVGEKMLALNGVEYQLQGEDIVIADTKKILAIAGIIGGMESAVSPTTTRILWESACFDASSIRFTSQRLGLRTDASTRYEKSLDPLLTESGMLRVIEYMKFLGKAFSFSGYSSYTNEQSIYYITITVELATIEKKLGIMLTVDTFESILTRLGFGFVAHDTSYDIAVPSWRATKDIRIWEDIAEEVGRVYGYSKIEAKPLTANFRIGKKNPQVSLRDATNTYFSHRRWYEVYHYSFSNEELDRKCGYPSMDGAIHIENAFNIEFTHMRRSLAPRLFISARENMKHAETFGFFEVGNIFHKKPSDSTLPAIGSPYAQVKKLAGALVGKSMESLKKDLEGYLLETIGYVPPIHEGDSHTSFLHPGISGRYVIDGLTLVVFGKLHPEVTHAFELPIDTLYFEAEYETLLRLGAEKEIRFEELQRFPVIPRELNFVFPERIQIGPIIRDLSSSHPWICDIAVISVYRDKERVGPDMKSVTFSFLLANPLSTITDEEALQVQNEIIARVEEKGFMLRK